MSSSNPCFKVELPANVNILDRSKNYHTLPIVLRVSTHIPTEYSTEPAVRLVVEIVSERGIKAYRGYYCSLT
ncbi:MAG: hypothetical protein DRJ49_07160 [Thermoprotei archaeon]|nr:MAG: hypothetical protein DRJ49_07160 [Thermoprotei archaeon]